MKFLSLCSGIEAASVAWNPLGWEAWAFSEIEPFPCAVLAHHYPTVPNHGDMTKFKAWPDHAIDLLCGGTPCQSFSVAGLRKGLDDPRGNLMLTFGAIAARYRPRWLVWENVPGVLSSGEGRDFGSFLGLLGQLGYGFAYRVLDAQFFGLAQRRKRVFVVGCLGDWRSAAAVLLELESLRGDPAPRREARARVVAASARSVDGCREVGQTLRANSGRNHIEADYIAHALTGEGFDASEDGTGRGTPLVADVCGALSDGAHYGGGTTVRTPTQGESLPSVALCLNAGAMGRQDSESETLIPTNGGVFDDALSIAFNARQDPINGPINGPIDCDGSTNGVLVPTMRVRGLTPRECARLQGFPDDYLDITFRGKPASDGVKYKALGNSWAIPPVRWIGRRIELVDAIKEAA